MARPQFLLPLRSVLSFLTIYPVGGRLDDISYVAKYMYLFPLAGAIIGITVGAAAYGAALFLNPFIVGLLAAALLVIVTGVQHTDALADFADGMMAKGTKEVKRKAMMDPAVGSAGVAALVLYFAGMIVAFGTLMPSTPLALLGGLVASEVIAKYIMVLLTAVGISAWPGFSSPFTTAMKNKTKLFAATGIAVAIVWFVSSYAGMIALGISLCFAATLHFASKRTLGGVSGDVLGASNEITRLVALIVIFSLPVPLLP